MFDFKKLSYDRNKIGKIPDLHHGQRHADFLHVQTYLQKYGYTSAEGAIEEQTDNSQTFKAIRFFQRFNRLPETGQFDSATRTLMASPRCGLPDVGSAVGPWDRRDLTFAFGDLLTTAPALVNQRQNALRNAFATWQAAGVGIQFREVAANTGPDILIEWRPSADPDFDMSGGTVAHADYPPGHSVIVAGLPLPIHFDNGESWAVGTTYDIESIALHEIGHILGLGHSGDQNAVMLSTYAGVRRALTQTDHEPLRSLYPPWQFMPGTLTQVSAASDGTVWGVNRHAQIWRWNRVRWDHITPELGRLVQVSVGNAATVWGVNSQDQVWRWNGSDLGRGWDQMPGALTQVSVAADGSVWGVNRQAQIYRWNGTGWDAVTPGSGRLVQVSVGDSATVWGVNSQDQIWRWNGSDWDQIPGALIHVAVGADGTVWGVNRWSQIFRLASANGAWEPITPEYGRLCQISVGNGGLVWGVNAQDNVFRWSRI